MLLFVTQIPRVVAETEALDLGSFRMGAKYLKKIEVQICTSIEGDESWY